MRILFDHGTPFPIRAFLAGHVVQRTQDLGWDRLTNGELLEAAETAGFDALLTTAKNIRYRQNLAGRRIGLVVIGNAQWPVLGPYVQLVVDALAAVAPGSYAEVTIPPA